MVSGRLENSRSSDPEELPLDRLEAFSDGVFAIAITLLVLELGVSLSEGQGLLEALLAEWPAYLAYLTSFLTLGVFWLEHSTVTSVLRAGDAVLFRLNLVVLLLASFLPFPTKLAGEFFGEREPEQVAVLFYGVTLLSLDLAMTAFARHGIAGRRLVRPDTNEQVLRTLGHLPSLLWYAGAIAVGLVLPTLAVLLYLAIAMFEAVPARAMRQLLRGGHASPSP
jgi:uncharacterized membrane protein